MTEPSPVVVQYGYYPCHILTLGRMLEAAFLDSARPKRVGITVLPLSWVASRLPCISYRELLHAASAGFNTQLGWAA